MDQEQIERAINFILDQQARFAAGLEEFRHASAQRGAEIDARLDRAVGLQADIDARLVRITAVQETQAGMITNIGLHLDQLAGRVDKLGDKVDKLAEMQRHTDGRLNIVISRVDNLIHQTGNPQ
jgi:hypothetical protein